MRLLRPLVLAAAVAGAAVLVFAAEEKTKMPGIGNDHVILIKGDPTTRGSFDGTWMYVNRDAHYAMWIRTKNGKRQVRIQYQSLANAEAFETDWDGKATYYVSGKPISFELKLGTNDPANLNGTWNWNAEFEASSRKETAELNIYRTGYGRTLQMDFKNFERTYVRNGVAKTIKVPNSWGWTKISKRELLWEELPF